MTGIPRPAPPHLIPQTCKTAQQPASGMHVSLSMRTVGWLSVWAVVVRMEEETVTHSGSFNAWYETAGNTMNAAGTSLGHWLIDTLGDLGAPIHLYVDAEPASAHVVHQLINHLDHFTTMSAPVLEKDRIQARNLMNAEAMNHPQEVHVWTDASIGLSGHVVGVGWVVCAHEGTTMISARSMSFSDEKKRFDSSVAELHAIYHALTAVSELLDDPWCERWSVTLRTDSRTAIEFIGRAERGADMGRSKALRSIAQTCHRKVQSLQVTLEWVRGHNGNIHNELAHRLAVYARRTVEFNIPQAVRATTLERFRMEARELTRASATNTTNKKNKENSHA